MTNYDLIMRDMTAEKLASIDFICDNVPILHCNHYKISECNQCKLDWLNQEAEVTQPSSIPTIKEVKTAARVIKDFCNSRNSNPETDCIKCPIKDMCDSEPYTWEV